jgi:hypothetical protein
MKLFPFVVLVIVVIVLGPFATIWALNTLFPALAIPYDLDTWCAMVVLKGFAISSIAYKK